MAKTTDKEIIEKIYRDWTYYEKVSDPTIEMKIAAIHSYPRLFLTMDLSSEELQLALLREFKEDISVSFYLLGDYLGRSHNKHEDTQYSVSLYSNFINPSEKVQHIILDRETRIVKTFKSYYNMYDSIKMRLVNNFWGHILDIKNPSDELIVAAVKQDLKALDYIKELSDDAKYKILESRDGFSETVHSGYDRFGDETYYSRNLFFKLGKLNCKCQVLAVKRFSYYILKEIPEQCEDAQIEGLKQSYAAIDYIKNPSERALSLFFSSLVETAHNLEKKEKKGEIHREIIEYLLKLEKPSRIRIIELDYNFAKYYENDLKLRYIASRMFDNKNIKENEVNLKKCKGDIFDYMYNHLKICCPRWYLKI